jgi:hypothetical protein
LVKPKEREYKEFEEYQEHKNGAAGRWNCRKTVNVIGKTGVQELQESRSSELGSFPEA